MNLTEYRRGQDTITRRVVATVVALLQTLTGVPLTALSTILSFRT